MVSEQIATNTRDTRRGRRRDAGAPTRPRWGVASILCLVVVLVGGIVFAYPLAAPWFADAVQADELARYENAANQLSPEERERILAAAHAYNANLPMGPLRDPYVINASGEAVSMADGRDEYERQLRIDPDDDRAPMARLTIPAIDVDLPVFHGTSEETLARGVGHFFGSGLPVGGKGVHSVLTAHSGYVDATLFDDLTELVVGDVFSVTTLGRRLTYRIDNIATVLPNESALLRQVQGEDFVTLVTCTPRYLNTHRLLVRGVFVDAQDVEDISHGSSQLISAPSVGVPWWILIVLGPPAVAYVLVRPRRRQPATTPRRADPHAPILDDEPLAPSGG